MKTYSCDTCTNRLYFENSVCVRCGSFLGYSRELRDIVVVDPTDARYVDDTGTTWWVCRNLSLSGCTWLADAPASDCFSCALTRTRPADEDLIGVTQFPVAERAKRQLIAELDALEIPVIGRTGPGGDPDRGLCFDMLSSVNENVVIGHADGVITIDLAEADASHREMVRHELGEAYRTMLGHLRHESGHYFQWFLLRSDDEIAACRALFGDDTADYQAEIDRHYAEGPPAGWHESYITTYATMHPYEDFAESWAHFLHIWDTVESAAETGLTDQRPETAPGFRSLVLTAWGPLSLGLNLVNRSMGKEDLYPFVIPAPVLDKLEFVANLSPVARL